MLIGENHSILNNNAIPYIKNGLCVIWDGIQNVGINEHNPNSMVWRDLINGFEMPLCKCASFLDDRLDINVTDGWVETYSSMGRISAANTLKCYCMRYIPTEEWSNEHDTGNFTSEYVFRLIDISTNPGGSSEQYAPLFSHAAGVGWGLTDFRDRYVNTKGNRMFQTDIPSKGSPNRYTWFTSETVPRSSTISMCGEMGGNGSGYLNGKVLFDEPWISGTNVRQFFTIKEPVVNTRHGGIIINGNWYYTRFNFKHIQAMCVRYYNRALSAQEIAKNYEIDKMRFHLDEE